MNANFLAARNNPLATERVTKIPFRHLSGDWKTQLDRLADLNFRGAIVGNQGSGKTTLLADLGSQLAERDLATHHAFIPRELTNHSQLLDMAIDKATDHVILVDGMERLGFRNRFRFFQATKRGIGWVVAAHKKCRLPTWIHCQTSNELMQHILIQLDLDFSEVKTAGATAFQTHNGNIRLALRDLYDQFAIGRFNHLIEHKCTTERS